MITGSTVNGTQNSRFCVIIFHDKLYLYAEVRNVVTFKSVYKPAMKLAVIVFITMLPLYRSESSIHLNATIPACVFCRTLDKYIDNVGATVSQSDCTDISCITSNKFLHFQTHTQTLLGTSFLESSGSELVLADMTHEQLSDLLVFALLGRHLVNTVQDHSVMQSTVYYYVYDIQHKTLQIRHPLCVVQKPIYTALLISSIAIIILGILTRVYRLDQQQTVVEGPQDGILQNNSTEQKKSKNQTYMLPTISLGGIIKPTDFRYRQVSTTEI